MRKKFKIVFSLFSLTNCTKESTKTDAQESLSGEDYNLYANNLLKIVINSLEDTTFKDFIKEEAMKQFDGDYDVLLASTFDNEMESSSLKSTRTKTFVKFSIKQQ